jgi:LuxR family maltose regulon positive regulatory protein
VGNGLVVVQAPAGYAKSTELSVFVSEVDYAVAWVSLDTGAANAYVFAQELARAILGDGSWRPERVEKPEDLRAYLSATLREFAKTTDSPLLVVIDNVHELNGSAGACDMLAWLVETIPPGYEIVLSGREPLPIPAIDRRVAAGEAAFIASDDLSFTPDEVAALCERRGTAIDARLADRIGWHSLRHHLPAGRQRPQRSPRSLGSLSRERCVGCRTQRIA